MDKGQLAIKIILYLLLIIFSLWTLFPIVWISITSLTPEHDLYSLPLKIIPENITTTNYFEINNYIPYFRYFLNSLMVAITSGVLSVVASFLGGYSLARFSFKGKDAIKLILLITQMFSILLLIVPLMVLFRKLLLTDSLLSLIFTYATLSIPFGTILFEGLFLGVSPSIEECAMIDGCSRLGVLMRVTFPLMVPGVAACFSFAFIWAWSDIFAGIMFLSSEEKFTLPIGLFMLIGKYEIRWGALSAGIVISLIPVLIMFYFAQKYIISGLTAGAVKE